MALLYRAARLRDRADTRVLTFVVTRSVTRDLDRDVTSKEFLYGYHKWAITFSRNDKILGVYLVLRSACEGIRVFLDFSFTLLNREHFSGNESFSGKQVRFTADSPAHGNRSFIPLPELFTRGFADRRGEFQIELTLSSPRTIFTSELRLAAQRHSGSSPSAASSVSRTSTIRSHPNRIESVYFSFGGFDWNVALLGEDGGCSLMLNRLSGFDHRCRVRFSASLGESDRGTRLESGIIDDLSDGGEGKVQGWHPRRRLQDFAHKGLIRVTLELIMARVVCEVSVPLALAVAPGAALPLSRAAQCYDRDKQAWAIRADSHADSVRLHVLYKDVHNVPRNHLKYMSWSAFLVRGNGAADPLPTSPHSHYYAQENTDDGLIMETDLPAVEVRTVSCPYIDLEGGLRVRIEWEDTYLLFQANYHRYDDVCRVHNIQMRREITALQSENFALERQLFSYQKSLEFTSGTASATGHHNEQSPEGRAYSLGERSLSTDTEYA